MFALSFFVFVFIFDVNGHLKVETILFRVHDKVVKDPGAVTADNVLKVSCCGFVPEISSVYDMWFCSRNQ